MLIDYRAPIRGFTNFYCEDLHMKRQDTAIINECLLKLAEDPSLKIQAKYAIGKNLRKISSEVDFIKKYLSEKRALLPKEFHDKREAILLQHAKKDEAGNAIITDEKEYIFENQPLVETDLLKLETEYSEALSQYKAKDQELSQWLDEDSTVTTYKIKLSHLGDKVTAADLMIIEELIEDDITE